VGEILSRGTDEDGFFTVRVYDGGAVPGGDDGRRMKVHPCRLLAARSSSAPNLVGGAMTTLSWKFPRTTPGNAKIGFDNRFKGRAESVWTLSTGAPSTVSRSSSRMRLTYTPLIRT